MYTGEIGCTYITFSPSQSCFHITWTMGIDLEGNLQSHSRVPIRVTRVGRFLVAAACDVGSSCGAYGPVVVTMPCAAFHPEAWAHVYGCCVLVPHLPVIIVLLDAGCPLLQPSAIVPSKQTRISKLCKDSSRKFSEKL